MHKKKQKKNNTLVKMEFIEKNRQFVCNNDKNHFD